MHRTRIKICGVRDAETAAAACFAGADAVGLVFAEGSVRRVDIDGACRVVAALSAFVEPVGLFVDSSNDRVREVAREVGLRTVQLHGRETVEQVKDLRPLQVIKAVAFSGDDFANRIREWCGVGDHLDALLIDAPERGAEDGEVGGGQGLTFDWGRLAELQESGALEGVPPFVIAGGLTVQNVGRAIGILKPYAVDVSSGVESRRGVKDVGLIDSFCQAAASADR